MNENQLTIVKEYEYYKPDIHKIDSLIDNCIRDCHNKYFHTFEYKCVYDNEYINIRNFKFFNITIADKEMNLYGLNKKLKDARENGFIFNQIENLKLKAYQI